YRGGAIVARYLPRMGAIATICALVVLIAICMVGLLKPNSLNAGFLPSNPIILPAQAMPGDPNAPTLTPLPPEAQATATAAAAAPSGFPPCPHVCGPSCPALPSGRGHSGGRHIVEHYWAANHRVGRWRRWRRWPNAWRRADYDGGLWAADSHIRPPRPECARS